MKVLTLVFTWLLAWTLASWACLECSSELCRTGQDELDLGASIYIPCQSHCCACFSCQLFYGSNGLGHISWRGVEMKSLGIWLLAPKVVGRRGPLVAQLSSTRNHWNLSLLGWTVLLSTCGGGCVEH